jgi:hypothetical protein
VLVLALCPETVFVAFMQRDGRVAEADLVKDLSR